MASGFNVAINIQTTGDARANAALGTVGKSASTAHVAVTGLTGAFKALSLALAALPIGFIIRELAQAVQKFDQIEDSLRAATGSAKGAAQEFGFVRAEARRLGLDLETTAASYGKFLAAANISGVSTKLAREGFTAMSEAVQGLGLNEEALTTGLQGLTKMMAENKVTAKGLSSLFGSEFKGGFAIAAQSIGVTTEALQKMIKEGRITADELLPKMFEWMHKTFGPEAAENAKQLEGQINRFHNAILELSAKGGGDLAKALGVVNKALEFMVDNLGHITAAFKFVFEGMIRGAKIIYDSWMFMVRGIVMALEKLGSINKIFGADNPLEGWTAALTIASGTISRTLEGWADSLNESAWEGIANDAKDISIATETTGKNLRDSAEAADVFAEAARRAHAAFVGMKPEQLAGAVDDPGAHGGLTFLDPGILRGIEEMADKLNETWEGIGKKMRGEARDGFLKNVAHDITAIWGGALSDVLSGAMTGVQALRQAISSTVAAIGSQLAGTKFGQGAGGVGISVGIGVFDALLNAAMKPGPNEAAAQFAVIAGKIQATIDNTLDAMQQLSQAAEDAINGILDDLGATLGSAEFGFKIRGGDIDVFVNGIRKGFTDATEAIGFLVTELFKTADVLGLSAEAANAVRLAAQQAGGNLAAFQSDLGFIKAFENFGKDNKTIALENLERWFEEASATAARLGLDLEKVNAEYEKQREEILGLAAAEKQRIEEEKRLMEERRREHQEHVAAQRDINEQIRELELAAGGASSGLVGLVRQVYDLDKSLADMNAAGLHGTGRLRDLTLQGLLDDILGPVNDVLNPLDEAGQIARRYADIREQVTFLAEQMGIAVQPLLDLIAAAEAAELNRLGTKATGSQYTITADSFTQNLDIVAEGAGKAGKGLEVLFGATQFFADQVRAVADQLADAIATFKSQFQAFFGGGNSIEEIKARIHAQAQELKTSFRGLPFADQRAAIEAAGGTWTGGGSAANAAFDAAVAEREAKLIADAIAEALRPLTDYFDDLRRNGAGLTQTQKFNNVFSDFQSAIASGDMEDAVALARLLTGEVGTGQFGSSSTAFRNLRDQIVAALSTAFGVPAPDLGTQSYQASSSAFYGRIATAAEQSVTIQRDGFADVVRRLENLGNRIEAGALRR